MLERELSFMARENLRMKEESEEENERENLKNKGTYNGERQQYYARTK